MSKMLCFTVIWTLILGKHEWTCNCCPTEKKQVAEMLRFWSHRSWRAELLSFPLHYHENISASQETAWPEEVRKNHGRVGKESHLQLARFLPHCPSVLLPNLLNGSFTEKISPLKVMVAPISGISTIMLMPSMEKEMPSFLKPGLTIFLLKYIWMQD